MGGIIISPVRELASQIFEVLQKFTKDTYLNVLYLVGSENFAENLNQIQTQACHIIVATPGRLEKILKIETKTFNYKSELNFQEFDMLILDEADRLLEMGFKKSLNEIFLRIPKQRRTGLFSATLTSEVKELVRAGMRNPVAVRVQVNSKLKKGETQKTPQKLENRYLQLPFDEKLQHLVNLLIAKIEHLGKWIIYGLTCAVVDYLYKVLSNIPHLQKIKFFSLHSKAPAHIRTRIHEEFKVNPPFFPTNFFLTKNQNSHKSSQETQFFYAPMLPRAV